jgi:hypothetical protein
MSSVQTSSKQSNGYFVVTAAGALVPYVPATGSGAGGSFVPGLMTAVTSGAGYTSARVLGAVLRDMGKTLVTGTSAVTERRVFRKVQVLNSAGSSFGISGASADSVSASGGGAYFTFYIELPSPGRSGLTNATDDQAAPVAYIPGMPVTF